MEIAQSAGDVGEGGGVGGGWNIIIFVTKGHIRNFITLKRIVWGVVVVPPPSNFEGSKDPIQIACVSKKVSLSPKS